MLCSRYQTVARGIFLAWLAGAGLCPRLPAEIIPADRRYSWEGNTGIPGGIPVVTNIYTTFATPPTLAALQAALGSCPSNQVVKLGAWTNTYGGDIQINRNGVVLRGTTDAQGRPLTKIFFSSGHLVVRAPIFNEGSLSTEVDLTADAARGSNTIAVTSVPTWIKAGELCIIDELDDTNLVSGVGQEGGATYREQVGNGPRGKAELVKVLSKTASTVTFESPLKESYRIRQMAQLCGSGYNAASQGSLKRAGVEDIQFEFTYTNSGLEAIKMENCDSCWLKNIRSIKCPGNYHVWQVFSYRCMIRHSEFFDAMLFGGGEGYGLALYHYSTGGLFEDNIIHRVHIGATVNYGSSGNVFAYNYIFDGYSVSQQEPSISAHGVCTWQGLYEGNYCHNKILFDYTHGSGASHHTVFRNRVLGQAVTTGDRVPISIEQYNRANNIVGNVLGQKGVQTAYARVAPAPCTGGTPIYRLGYFNNPNCTVTNHDPAAIHATLIHANYDVVTATNNGIVWDGAIPDRTLPDSYYLTTKPAWFGRLPWPPYTPGNTNSIWPTNIPAGYRFVFGVDPAFTTITRSGSNVVLNWSGTLQQADQVTGPFTNVLNATAPLTLPVSAARRFYRAQ